MNDQTPMKVDFDTRVEQFVRLRDKIAKLDEDHKKVMEPFRETLEQLNSVLIAHLNSISADSVRTKHGTVSRTTKKSASIADKTAFWAYVVSQGKWDLIDYKANPVHVADHIKETTIKDDQGNVVTPGVVPGVNYSERFVAGVRRPTTTKE